MHNVPCDEDLENCPFRIYDVETGFQFCNYHRVLAKLIVNHQFARIPALINKACDPIKLEEMRLKTIRQIAKKKTMDFLKNAREGDIVFCTIRAQPEVILLEKPLTESKFVSCQTIDGKIIRVQAAHLFRISKGNYYGEYFIDGIENSSKAQDLEYRAKYYGFRAEIEKKKRRFSFKDLWRFTKRS